MSGDLPALQRLLGTPEMAWFLTRVRRRLPHAEGRALSGTLRLNDPTGEQRAAAWRLVGRPKRSGQALTVDLALVETVLRRGPWPAGLGDAVETLTGPVIDHATQRAREAAAWAGARDALAPAASRFPGLEHWWQAWCARGGLKRASAAEAARLGETSSPALGRRLVEALAEVLELLPAKEEPLAVLARRATGDAHGLDADRPLGRLCAAVVLQAFSPASEPAEVDLPVRQIWAAAGVLLSSVSSTVVCLGVRGGGSGGVGDSPAQGATAAIVEASRRARMAVVLTLEQVRSGGIGPVAPSGVIYVCENPTVVEVVAARWVRSGPLVGAEDPVLVCTSGHPTTAVVDLLQVLAAEGAPVLYHGDFDWPGLRIAHALSRHIDWRPWRFTGADYWAAITRRRGTGGEQDALALSGTPAPSPWDPELAHAMSEAGVALEEEAVVDLLAADVLGH